MVVQNFAPKQHWLGINKSLKYVTLAYLLQFYKGERNQTVEYDKWSDLIPFHYIFATKHHFLHKTKIWFKVWDDAMCIALIFGYYMICDIIKIIFSNHKNIELFYTIKLYICGHIPHIYVIASLISIYSLLVWWMCNI